MLTHLDYVEGSLVCPFTTQEEPDLSKLRCGHLVSRQEWERYENIDKSQDRRLSCPLCKKEVTEVGAILPVENVKRVIQDVKENCLWLKHTLSWESGSIAQPYTQPPFIRAMSHSDDVHDKPAFAIPNWRVDGDFDTRGTTRSPSPLSDSAVSELHSNPPIFREENSDVRNLTPNSPKDFTARTDSFVQSPTTVQSSPSERRPSQKPVRKPEGSPTSKTDRSDTIRTIEQSYSNDDHGRRHERSSTANSKTSFFSTRSTKRNSQISLMSESGSVVHSLTTDMSVVNLVQGKKQYQGTAISQTCLAIALIDLYSFTVLSLPMHTDLKFAADLPVICYGANDGRFGNSKNVISETTHMTPKYMRAVMSDRSLCIACEEGFIEVHDARTGRQLKRIEASANCNMAMSPNGEILALAMDSGELQVFSSGLDWDFNTEHTWVIRETENSSLRFVKCMAFSTNSTYLSICTFDNIIHTYKLDMKSNSSTLLSTYDQIVAEGYGVTGLALYIP
jgi:hypothetical protein